MAKKKVKVSDSASPGLDCSYSPSMYIDFDSMKEVSGVSVGDKITVKITGTVKSVEQREREEGGKKETSSCVSLKDFTAEIAEGENEFSKLAEDDDE